MSAKAVQFCLKCEHLSFSFKVNRITSFSPLFIYVAIFLFKKLTIAAAKLKQYCQTTKLSSRLKIIQTVKRCFIEIILMDLKGIKTTYNPNWVGKNESAVD